MDSQNSKGDAGAKAKEEDTKSSVAKTGGASSSRANGSDQECSNPERETYNKLRKTLKELTKKKLALDEELETIEDRIYVEEGTYLQEASAGNIVKGYDQYTKSSQNRRKSILVEQDRIFSRSSTAFDAES